MLGRPQLVLPRRNRGWLPGGIPRIDWTNPLTAGLQFCWISLSGYQVNLVNNAKAGTTLPPRGSVYGSETLFNVTGGVPWTLAQVNNTADCTVAALAKPNATTSGSIGDCLYTQRGGSPLVVLRFNANYDAVGGGAVNGVLGIVFAGGGFSNGAATSIAGVIDGKYHVLAGGRQGSVFSLYSDGKNVTNTTANSSANFYNIAATAVIGDELSEGFIPNAPIVIVVGAARAWSPSEHLSFGKMPFQFLIFPEDRLAAQLVGGAAAPPAISGPYWLQDWPMPTDPIEIVSY